jgi:hypothetical protein
MPTAPINAIFAPKADMKQHQRNCHSEVMWWFVEQPIQ